MKKLFKKLIAIGLLSCTMLSAAMLPGFAANHTYYYANGLVYDEYGNQFDAEAYITATGQTFEHSKSGGYVQIRDTLISNQATSMVATVKVTYTDGTVEGTRASEYYGSMDFNTRHEVTMYGEYGSSGYDFDKTKIVQTYRATVRATHQYVAPIVKATSNFTEPTAISSTYNYTVNKTLQQILASN